MKNIPDPDRRADYRPDDASGQPTVPPGTPTEAPEVNVETRKAGRWILPLIAIAILIIVLVVLGVMYL